MIENNFCVRQKNRTKYYQCFKLLYFELSICHNKFTLWHIRLKIHIQKNKFISLKLYSFCPLFSVNAKKTHSNRSILHVLLLSKKKRLKNLQKQQLQKKFFSSMCVAGTTFFNECFLFHVITGRHLFYRYPEVFFNLHAVALFETSVLKEVCVLFSTSRITQKQPIRGVLSKNCSENMQQIYRRTPMTKCDSNKFQKCDSNHISSWVLSCKFAAYFQNTFS